MNERSISVAVADPSDRPAIASFYARVGYGRELGATDRILVAREAGALVAAVRLCVEHDALVLRGMQVAPERRGGGVGSRLLAAVSAEIGRSSCWCVPYTHLVAFYARIGFRLASTGEIPAFVAARRQECVCAGHDVLVMVRPADWVDPTRRSGRGAGRSG